MFAIKRRVKNLVESIFDVQIYSAHPHGRDDCHDIRGTGIAIKNILDVGAHVGESALKFTENFPYSTIHSFEPAAQTAELLRNNVARHENVRVHQMAVGATMGSATIYHMRHSTMNSLVRPEFAEGEEMVRVTTIDEFVNANALLHIDLLKIDAEGSDLDVLAGANVVLGQGRVSFVLVEVTFTRTNKYHVLFDDVRDFLALKQFSVFGFYDQQLEWSGENRLRFSNACFIHESVVMPQRNSVT